jgi:hypothetical protein
MHAEAFDGFGRMLKLSGVDPGTIKKALDVGGADVNGTARGYFPNAEWLGLDIEPAPAVDIVANAATWRSKRRFDAVIATELFEHTPEWREIIETMALHLGKNGPQLFVTTAASTGRPGHGARGEWGVPAGQYYGNVDPEALSDVLDKYFLNVHVEFNPNPGDVYAYAQGVRL